MQFHFGQLSCDLAIQVACKRKISREHDIKVTLVAHVGGNINHAITHNRLDNWRIVIAGDGVGQRVEIRGDQRMVGKPVLEDEVARTKNDVTWFVP